MSRLSSENPHELCPRYCKDNAIPPPSHVSILEAERAEIRLKVEPNRKYLICKDLICYYSPYFNALLRGGFRETQQETIVLEESITVEIFETFIEWLYSRDNLDSLANLAIIQLARLYIFADAHETPDLMRSCTDLLYFHLIKKNSDRVVPTYDEVIEVYAKQPDGSPLAQLFADCYALNYSTYYDKDEREMEIRPEVPAQFFYNVMCRQSRATRKSVAGSNGPRKPTVCRYHNHKSKEERQKCIQAQRRWSPYPATIQGTKRQRVRPSQSQPPNPLLHPVQILIQNALREHRNNAQNPAQNVAANYFQNNAANNAQGPQLNNAAQGNPLNSDRPIQDDSDDDIDDDSDVEL